MELRRSGFAISGNQRQIAAVVRSGGWGDVWIWENGISARAWVWNPNIRAFAFWAELGVGQGENFTVDQNAGMGYWDGATYMIRNEDFISETPVGTFNQSLEITLVNENCADAGISRMLFALNSGIVESETQSIGGPRCWVIQHAVVDGREYSVNLFRGGLRSSAILDKVVYTVGPKTDGTIQSDTMLIQLEIVNGTEVYRWSFGKAFILPVTRKQLYPGRESGSETTSSSGTKRARYCRWPITRSRSYTSGEV